MIDFHKMRTWICDQQLQCIPLKTCKRMSFIERIAYRITTKSSENKDVHWLHHSTSALMAYDNVLDYLEEHKND